MSTTTEYFRIPGRGNTRQEIIDWALAEGSEYFGVPASRIDITIDTSTLHRVEDVEETTGFGKQARVDRVAPAFRYVVEVVMHTNLVTSGSRSAKDWT